MNIIQIKSTAFKETALLVLVLFLSGCATTLPPTIVKKTAPPAEVPERKVCSGQKGTVFLIASSSQYDEHVIPEIETAFSRQCYAVDKRYLDQKPTRLGYVNTDGRMCAMTGTLDRQTRQRRGSPSHRTDRGSILSNIFAIIMVCCRRMPSQAMTGCSAQSVTVAR